VKAKDNCLIKYVCAGRGKQSKKGNVSHLVTAVTSGRDVIQGVKIRESE
jgi:hypothetical protein